MATAISILLFNILKLTIIKIKMDLQPFSMNTLKILFFFCFGLLHCFVFTFN